MNIRTASVLVITIGIILFIGHQYSTAQAEAKADAPGLKIGVVSIQKIFRNCQRSGKYKEQATAERESADAGLEKLVKEIEADRAGLKTLKEGTTDHLEMVRNVLNKQATLEAQREFLKREIELKDQRWTEQLYKDILDATKKIAQEKGLDIVLERDEPEFPTSSVNDLVLTMRTHKLIYDSGCLDITDEVTGRLDAQEGGKGK